MPIWLEEVDVLFLGADLLPMLILAMGSAMFVGNFLAMIKPRKRVVESGELEKAPIKRSIIMSLGGLACASWAIATLTT
ncbi:MAG: hypothetical protein GWP30_11110 [Actinobacteria bacterium]|nr:hypothetical protein [Actinomycetota bacterium]